MKKMFFSGLLIFMDLELHYNSKLKQISSKIIFITVILFSVAINGCKKEKEDLTAGLVGTYSGEYQWQDNMNNWELKKENGILTIIRIDETHVRISNNLGLFDFGFVEVAKKNPQDGKIYFNQNIKNPVYGNLPFGYLVTGSRHENNLDLYFAYNQLKFTGVFVQ